MTVLRRLLFVLAALVAAWLVAAIVIPLIDSPPFDSIIVRGTAFRQRLSRSQKTSIENSSPLQHACTIESCSV